MTERVLVVAAHPDDEVIGCGGTLLKHIDKGDDVLIIFMADGESSRPSADLKNKIVQRYAQAQRAAELIGTSRSPEFLNFPDNQMDTIPFLHIVQSLEKVTKNYSPTIIYTHWPHDLNIDHRLTYQAVNTAFRPTPSAAVTEINCFEVNSATEWNFSPDIAFSPNLYVEIDIEKKLTLIDCYSQEFADYPHSRSKLAITHSNGVRGSTVGIESAEAFQQVLKIRRD